jgi:hypothetical protein
MLVASSESQWLPGSGLHYALETVFREKSAAEWPSDCGAE